jgi:4Fe-4S ferredoxin
MMEIEKEMDVKDSHILARQKSKERDILLDYDYKKCAGCSICVALCPKKALQEGPLQEIAKGLDAPPVLIDLEACAFCGMCVNFCPTKAFRMTVTDIPVAGAASEDTDASVGADEAEARA